MAKKQAVWGIDIGQCALKALRCVEGEGDQIVANSFDYIEYPKSLSQPDSKPEETVREALEQFLSRNKVRGDKVAMSVSGQAGLARFFRPPATEPKLLPSIVKYEAKQQIPFQIDEVVWDWQQIGGYIEDGQLTDAEVGLFAMKREAVFRAMQPFLDAGVEVDFVQLSPIATYNMICHDLLGELPDPQEVDPENPPAYTLVIAVGTESTDVVITNGLRLWLRNIAIGGNHFTKQLSREMKLTQAKAEHLKLNSRQAEDPKALFTAMRPVFTDLGDELGRSLNYFRSIDRHAEFGKTILLGNATKLPGLRQYLEQNLELKIDRFEKFEKLVGEDVITQKAFADNMRAFAPCYGLCVQSLQKSALTTNLLPQEFVVEKIVRSKKPWLLGAVALVMMGLAVQHAAGSFFQYRTSDDFVDAAGTSWKQSKSQASAVSKKSADAKSEDDGLKQKLVFVNSLGDELVSASTSRTQILRILSAISQTIPKDPRSQDIQVDPETLPFVDREEIFIDGWRQEYNEDLATWFVEDIKEKHDKELRLLDKALAAQAGQPAASSAADPEAVATEAAAGESATEPKGPGWVLQLSGHHYVNSKERESLSKPTGVEFLRLSFLNSLLKTEVVVGGETFLLEDLGVVKPTIVLASPAIPTLVPGAKEEEPEEEVAMTDFGFGNDSSKQGGNYGGAGSGSGRSGRSGGGMGGGGGGGDKSGADGTSGGEIKDGVPAERTNFIIGLAWMPQSVEASLARREARLKAKQEAEAKAAEAAAQTETATDQ